MRNLINLLLTLLLMISAGSTLTRPLAAQEGEGQNASPQQQTQQSPQGQASSSAVVQSVTGCLIKSDTGYSLKTDSDTYPIETDKDLSQYVGKQIKVTGILEHHNTAVPSGTGANSTTITDLRLRLVASVVGDCAQPSK